MLNLNRLSFQISLFVLSVCWSTTASAHFPWLKLQKQADQSYQLQAYFSENPQPEDKAFLKYLSESKIERLAGRDGTETVTLDPQDEILARKVSTKEAESLFVLNKTFGVMTRGDDSFLLEYKAMTGPGLSSFGWRGVSEKIDNGLAIDPDFEDGKLTITSIFNGKPVSGCEVVFYFQDKENEFAKSDVVVTNQDGLASISVKNRTLKAVRVLHEESAEGEYDGKPYAKVKYYTTLTIPDLTYIDMKISQPYPSLPEAVTSFGAAIENNVLYYYGGNKGGAHSYSEEDHARTLWSLELKPDAQWKNLGDGPAIQGLAMVADQGKLYRLGGFRAKNKDDEDQDLWSQAQASCYEIQSGTWTELPKLPEPRSSFDAVVLDHTIYVIGGWQLQGDTSKSIWHKTAWKLNLKASPITWESIKNPPFQKRAISAAAFQGKIYVMGGMQSNGQIATTSHSYDPKTDTWSEGPDLIGQGITGFGSSAFPLGDRLYVSTFDGTLQRLSADGKSWELAGNLKNVRFFHRMVAHEPNQLIILGGTNMQSGKFDEVDVIKP